MVPNTKYIRYFDLKLYEYGFVLMLPSMLAPTVLPQVCPSCQSCFIHLADSSLWGQRLDLETVGALNDKIAEGDMSHLILIQEALQEKRIAEIAAQIAERKTAKIVMIAGPSSSGKTTFSHRLSVQLEAIGLKPHPIAVDNYFVNRDGQSKG